MTGTDFATTITGAVTSGGLTPTAIAGVAGAAIALGVVMVGFKRVWGFFKGLAK